jgi:hypothetical protein
MLELTTGQINALRSFIGKTDDKKEYRRAVAVFQKADGFSIKHPIYRKHLCKERR